MIKKLFCLTALQEAKLFVSVTLAMPNAFQENLYHGNSSTHSFRIPTLSGIIYLLGTYCLPSEKQITGMIGYVSESIGDIRILENSAD